MDLTPDDDLFLRALVKSSRQRTVHLKWTDRDGSARVTALQPAEATRLNTLARARRISAEALLREAAHLPVAGKPAATPTPPPATA
jgi:hypothetical protein